MEIYPIELNGIRYEKEDCADLFVCFYHSEDDLDFNCSVYVADGMRIQPDGTWLP